jgi:outer membrane lipoprotein-sorting protein
MRLGMRGDVRMRVIIQNAECKKRQRQEYMKKIILIFAVFCLVLSASFMVCAQEQQTSQEQPQEPLRGKAGAFARIEKAVSTINAVASEFRQERRLAMLKEPVVSTGRFYYEKPDKLRWEFISPDPSGFFVNGKFAKQWKGKNSSPEVFEPQQNSVIRAIVDQILAWTKADFTWIEHRYAVIVVKEDPIVLKLVPKSSKERKYIDHILISFEADTNYANAVDIVEKGGDSTRIGFFNMIINNSPQRELFE